MARARATPPEVDDEEAGAPDRIDIYVGSRIKARRMYLDISQQSLAATLGLTFQQVQKYENGTNRVSASRLKEIADALRVEPGYFFPPAREEAVSDEDLQRQQRLTEAEAMQLVRYYYAIPDLRMREHLLSLMRIAASAGKPD